MRNQDQSSRLLLLISTRFVPREFALHQLLPAPFGSTAAIMFDVPTMSLITLKMYDILGNEVVTLAEGRAYEPGRYEERIETSRLASGLYYYSFFAQGADEESSIVYHDMRKMELLK